ncbi:MAG: hypothetical protein JO284_18425 [Planctomycetaceae bacterium]|nr:hypothetical protein [Planctomycetaceae bacterium]
MTATSALRPRGRARPSSDSPSASTCLAQATNLSLTVSASICRIWIFPWMACYAHPGRESR